MILFMMCNVNQGSVESTAIELSYLAHMMDAILGVALLILSSPAYCAANCVSPRAHSNVES